MSSGIVGATNEIFCSYAHEDLQYIEAFRSHLSQLQREGIISSWYDGLIGAGQHWQREIEIHLNSANITLLFVSADFLASDFCMETELPIALARSNHKEALVIPVIVRECDWQTAPFAHLQALPKGLTPITKWRHRDEAYTQIVKSIRGFVHNQQVPPMGCSLLNLPFHRNPLFTGCEEILQKLHASLESRKETALIQAIKGLGGIGKTQTAIEYAYRYQHHYARIIWLNSESRETIISDVTRLARDINTPGCYDKDQNIVVWGFLNWLETQRNWLLILDNVEDIALARSYMPKGNQGHLLLTTRRQAVGNTIKGISLDAMDEETGGTFLLKRAKRIADDLSSEPISTKEMQPAKRLSNVLGGLPLALDQAGGYIERKQCSVERYLQIYEQAHECLLAESGFPEDTTEYKYTVATTWSLSFQQVTQEKHGEAATDLLRLCAFLAPDDIPVSLFEAPSSIAIDLYGPDLGQVSVNPVQLDKALEALLKYSLIRCEDDALFIHRLVQTALRDAMTEEDRSLWAKRAIQLMNAIFPDSQKVEAWSLCQDLLPHMLACARWIAHMHIRTEISASLLHRTAHYLVEQGSYEEAEPLHKEGLDIRREVLGERHPDTATSLNSLAALYWRQGRYEEAEPLYSEGLDIRREELGEQHPSTVTSLNNLAALRESQGRYEEAEPLHKEALAIRRKALGEQHPDTATSLNNLANLYSNQGRYEEAEPLYTESLKISKKVLGEQHPSTATGLNNLAELYSNQGRYEEAESLYQQALVIRREVLGARHPDTAISLNNLAKLYSNQGRYEEAESLYQQALVIRREVLGEWHPDTATNLSCLAVLYKGLGRYEEAEPLYTESLKISRKVLGEQHPHTATNLNNLAELYRSQARYEEAEPLHKEALAIWRKVLGEQHPDTATSLNNLAELYESQGRYEEAEPLMREALAIRRKALGERHPDTANSMHNLAGLYYRQKRYEEAEPLYREALAIIRKVLGEQHPDTGASLNNLAELYRSQGRYEEAKPLYEEALAITRKVLGEQHPHTAGSLNNLALFYESQGQYEKAEPLYRQALAICINILGEQHPNTQIVLSNYARFRRERSNKR